MRLADFVCDHAVHVLVTSQMESDGHLQPSKPMLWNPSPWRIKCTVCATQKKCIKGHQVAVKHSLRKWIVKHKYLTLAQRTGTKFSKGSGARKASPPTPVSGGVFLNPCAGALSDAASYKGKPSEEQVTKSQVNV